jgi:hypothetical protein
VVARVPDEPLTRPSAQSILTGSNGSALPLC